MIYTSKYSRIRWEGDVYILEQRCFFFWWLELVRFRIVDKKVVIL